MKDIGAFFPISFSLFSRAYFSEGLKLDIPYEFNVIIQELGLKVDAVRFDGSVYGSYNPIRKQIKLASPEIEIFLHELSHAVDDRLNGLKAGQYKDQEVVAEFSGAVIGHLMGYKVPLGKGDGLKELSFSDRLKAGWSKADLMRYYVMDEKQYDKVLACLESIRKGERL